MQAVGVASYPGPATGDFKPRAELCAHAVAMIPTDRRRTGQITASQPEREHACRDYDREDAEPQPQRRSREASQLSFQTRWVPVHDQRNAPEPKAHPGREACDRESDQITECRPRSSNHRGLRTSRLPPS